MRPVDHRASLLKEGVSEMEIDTSPAVKVSDLYTQLKAGQREVEFLEVQVSFSDLKSSAVCFCAKQVSCLVQLRMITIWVRLQSGSCYRARHSQAQWLPRHKYVAVNQ